MLACGKTERGKPHPYIYNFEKIAAYSNGPDIWKPLSPFNLGPFPVTEKFNPNDIFTDGIRPGWTKFWNGIEWMQTINCLSFERYWQGGKVYQKDLSEISFHNHISSINTPILGKYTLNSSFYERRIDMFTNPNRAKTSVRNPLPKATYGKPIQGFYSNEFIDYVSSRKKYYCPGYVYFASQTRTYQTLLEKHQRGENLLIVGPDGLNTPITDQNMRNIINDPKYIFGHELVICCMLANLTPWIDV